MFHDAICISHNLTEEERHFGMPNEVHTRAHSRHTLIGCFLKCVYGCLHHSGVCGCLTECVVWICNPYVAVTGSPVSIYTPCANGVNPQGNLSALFCSLSSSLTPSSLILFLTIISQWCVRSGEEGAFCHKCLARWSGHVLFTLW